VLVKGGFGSGSECEKKWYEERRKGGEIGGGWVDLYEIWKGD